MQNVKKYQVFVSSTYTDLKEERDEVMKAILTHYHIPIGMEMFSADDDEQWTTIKETIDVSDYYVLIIGHRYGSLSKEGISYTEKEFRYAVENKIPAYVFVRERDLATTPAQRDNKPENAAKLETFINNATDGRMVSFWKHKSDLALLVMAALNKAFTRTSRTGWVRSDQVINSDAVLEQIAELSKRNMQLEKENQEFRSASLYLQRKPSFKFIFNHNLPLKLTIDDERFLKDQFYPGDDNYNKAKKYFLRQFCFDCLDVSLTNTGTMTATNIYIDFDFPRAIVFKDENLRPSNFGPPKNKHSESLQRIAKADSAFFNNLPYTQGFETPDRVATTWPGGVSRLTFQINKLPHTRTFTFYEIFLSALDVVESPVLHVKISCEQLPEPLFFDVPFEIQDVTSER